MAEAKIPKSPDPRTPGKTKKRLREKLEKILESGDERSIKAADYVLDCLLAKIAADRKKERAAAL